MKIVHRHNIDIWILIKISIHKSIGRMGAELHLQRVHMLSSYIITMKYRILEQASHTEQVINVLLLLMLIMHVKFVLYV